MPLHTDRSRAAIALESCVMAAIHNEVFESVTQTHKADDIALHGFMEQLLAGEYDVSGTSPDLWVQVSTDTDTSLKQRPYHTVLPQALYSYVDSSLKFDFAAQCTSVRMYHNVSMCHNISQCIKCQHPVSQYSSFDVKAGA